MLDATATLPPPTTAPESVPVRALLAGLPPAVREGCEARLTLGARTYGVELHTHNGRPFLTDAYQEALDCTVYAVGARAEGAGTVAEWERLREAARAAYVEVCHGATLAALRAGGPRERG